MACAKKGEVHKEMMAMGPVILPNSMCAEHGTVSLSNDKEGDRMVCELQNQLGTHIPRCVCIDEGFSERERELAFEMMRGTASMQVCGGAAQCGGSTALGTK
ncbi:MAG TPA: hypothetical protein VH083_16580 [Myxococcales bacterium]|nr:hypothetical protein [Myxococcales bacterium]